MLEAIVSITPRYQIHIPSSFRAKLKIRGGSRAKLKLDKKRMIIAPIEDDVMALAGQFKVERPVEAEKIRKVIDYSKW